MGEEPSSRARGQTCPRGMTKPQESPPAVPRVEAAAENTQQFSTQATFLVAQASCLPLCPPVPRPPPEEERVTAEPSHTNGQGGLSTAPQATPTSNDLHKLRAGHCQEGHPGLCRHRLGQKRLSTAGGPEQQRTLRDFGTKLKEALWALEKQQTMHRWPQGLQTRRETGSRATTNQPRVTRFGRK